MNALNDEAGKAVLEQSPPKRQSAGLRDVASKAGVGMSTVSTVLNGSRNNTRVSAATRERILVAARELQYHPNAVARRLTGRPTRTIGVLFGLDRASVSLVDPFALSIFQGVVAGAAESGYNVILFTEPWHSAERSGGTLRDGSTDGVILIAVSTDSDIVTSVTDFHLPAVAVSSSVANRIPSVDIDSVVGATLATRHLIELGHRRIAHLSGDENLVSAVDRREAFCAALAEVGLPAEDYPLLAGSYEASSGYERTRRLLRMAKPPTAIFAANDSLALAAMSAARDCGVDVPSQLSIVGFDDIPAWSILSGLTTVRQPLADIGRMGSATLISLIEHGRVEQNRHIFAPELVVRTSTGAAPIARD